MLRDSPAVSHVAMDQGRVQVQIAQNAENIGVFKDPRRMTGFCSLTLGPSQSRSLHTVIDRGLHGMSVVSVHR